MPPPFAERLAHLRPTAVNRVLAEVRQFQGRLPIHSLMRGQPDFATPAHIVAAGQEALARGRTGYPDNRGEANLRQAIAEKLQRDQSLHYDWQKEILVTDGATGGLFAALGVLLEPGDEVLLPDPIYDAYHAPIAAWGGKSRPIASTIRDGRFTFERAELERVWSPRTKVLLLNNPWNPTGAVLERGEIRAIADFALERNLWIVSDEIYEGMVYDGLVPVSPAQLGPDVRERTIVVNSLSKTYAMTGWRCGYNAGPAEAIGAMLLLWQQFSRGPAMFVQDAAAAALRDDQSCVVNVTRELQRRRDLAIACLDGLPNIDLLKPEGGLFVMVDVRRLGKPSDEVRRFLLEKFGVVVIHGSAYGPGGEGTLRVSFAAGGEVLEHGLAALRQGLAAMAV